MSLKTEHFRTVYSEVRWEVFRNTEITEKGSCDPETVNNKHTSQRQQQQSHKWCELQNLSVQASFFFVFSNPVALSSSLFGK